MALLICSLLMGLQSVPGIIKPYSKGSCSSSRRCRRSRSVIALLRRALQYDATFRRHGGGPRDAAAGGERPHRLVALPAARALPAPLIVPPSARGVHGRRLPPTATVPMKRSSSNVPGASRLGAGSAFARRVRAPRTRRRTAPAASGLPVLVDRLRSAHPRVTFGHRRRQRLLRAARVRPPRCRELPVLVDQLRSHAVRAGSAAPHCSRDQKRRGTAAAG